MRAEGSGQVRWRRAGAVWALRSAAHCQVDRDGEPLSARTVADNIQKYLIFAILSCIPDRQVQRMYIYNCIPDRQVQRIHM